MPDQQPQSDVNTAIRPRKWGRIRVGAGVFILILLLAAGYRTYQIVSRPSPIHIAFANSMSGEVESVGTELLDAAQLYVDEVNRAGGVDGHPVVLDVFDDKGSPATARENVRKIADSPAVAVLGHFLSAASLAAGPGYAEAHIPALTPQALADDITIGNPYYFRAQTPNSIQGQWLAHYIQEVLIARSGQFPGNADIDLVTSKDNFGGSFARGFIPAMGEQIPKTWTFDAQPSQLAAQVRAVAASLAREPEPRVIVIGASIDVSAALVKAIRRQGIQSMLIVAAAGSDTYLGAFANEPEERAQPGFFTTNLYTTASVMFDTVGPIGQKFAEDYAATTGRRPSWFSAGANDAMRLLIEALRRAHPADTAQSKAEDREKVRTALAGIDSAEHGVPGLAGQLYFNAGRDMPRSLRFGYYDRGRLVSAPLQLVAVQHPDLIDLWKQLKTGNVINIGPNFFWVQRVVYTGIDVAHLNHVDVKGGTFNADLYVWMRYGGDNADPTHIEFPDLIVNSLPPPFDPAQPVEQGELDGLNYRLWRFTGDFKAEFDLHNFPFDSQSLIVRFQNREEPREQVEYVTDTFGLHVHRPDHTPFAERSAFSDLQLWHVTDVSFFVHAFSISSTQGKPALFDNDDRNEFGGFDTAVAIHRDVFAFMVKTLVPLFLLVLVVFATLFFPASLTKERTTIPVTGILTSAVLMISINNQLPSLGYTMALEYIFYVFFGLCLMAMCSGFMSEILRNKKYHGHAIAVDLIARIAYVTVVVVTIAAFLWMYAIK
jgi:ABC-type branched-subunit amino acid transport system substrate-binding protein